MGCNYSTPPQKILIPDPENVNTNGDQFMTFNHVSGYKSYLFGFDDKQISTIDANTTIKLSNFAIKGLQESFDSINAIAHLCTEQLYVVCPVYVDQKSGEILDTQLATTGTGMVNESCIDTAHRELAEEIGIVTNSCVTIREYPIGENQKRHETSFIVNISNAKKFDSKINLAITGIDNKKKKVQIVAYGTLDNLRKLYLTVDERPDSNDLLTIKYVRFISLKEFF